MMKIKRPFVTMSTIQEEKVNWLLKPYIMRGALIMLEGHPGQGKSTFIAGLTGCITAGRPLPFGNIRGTGSVLLFSAEDDPSRVLRRRLEANGADLAKVRIQNEPFALGELGIALLRKELFKRTPELVVIDPLVSYLDESTDLNDAAEMTRFLNSLDELAREFDVAILCVRHHRKSESDHALHRGLGSIAISGRVRSVLSLGRHPDDIEIRAVAHAKCSWAKEGPTILFKIINRGGTSVVEWLEPSSDVTVDDLLRHPPSRRGRQDDERSAAKAFLQHELAEGPRPTSELLSKAEGRSFSEMTLRRAADELHVIKTKLGKIWAWALPKSAS